MIRRRTSEAGGGVLWFTFLDVLTCTMGSLVLLLVVLAQKASNVTLEEALANAKKPQAASTGTAPKPPVTAEPASDEIAQDEPAVETAEESKLVEEVKDGITPEQLEKELASLREQMPKLEQLRADAAQRVKDEEDRVSHLEEHERRLEHELAKLHVTLTRLEEAEKQQSVDQESAESNLERLKQLVVDTEKEIEKLRKESTGKKSYAIVPYKGANGTMRRPIYIECTKDAVTIYPEGIKLTAADFDGPLRSGNPLAAAIRAAREELNARATAAGMTDLPDPYPLIIVRPDGAYAYSAALSAISSWDADFGYEFVDADWKLEFPDPDPRLDQIMRHAVDQARQRQAMLAKAAPRQYGSRLALGSGEGGDGSGGMGGGFEGVAQPGGNGDRIGDHSGENWMQASGGQDSGAGTGDGTGTGGGGQAGGQRYATAGANGMSTSGQGGTGGGATGNFSGQPGTGGTDANGQPAAAGQQQPAGQAGGNMMAGAGGPAGAAGPAGTQSGQGVAGGTEASGSTTPTGRSTFAGASSPTGATSGQSGAAAGAASSNATAANGAAGSSGGSESSSGSSGGASSSSAGGGAQGGASGGAVSYTAGQAASAANSRGANWANEAASRRASAISRPIRVVVKPAQIDVMPANQGGSGPAEQPMAISFHQPTDRVLDQLAASVKERMADWGQAGHNMYWRPTLLLQVEPGAEQHAIRLNDLLRDSGIDVKFQEVAARTGEGAGSGTTR